MLKINSGFLPRPGLSLFALLLMFALITVSPPTQAAIGGKRAAVLGPFSTGNVTGSQGPSSHHHNPAYGFAWDFYGGGADKAVYPHMNTGDGNLTMKVTDISPLTGFGDTVTVEVKVDNVIVGVVAYTHLVNVQVADEATVTASTILGYTAPSTSFSEQILNEDMNQDGDKNDTCYGFKCDPNKWLVYNLTGIHTHVSFKQACYGSQTTYASIPATEGIALLSQNYGSTNSNSCDVTELNSVAAGNPSVPLSPYNQNVKINGDDRADFVTARTVGGFVVGYGSANGSLTEGPLSLTNWNVTSWAGTGDFNGDGSGDILVAIPNGGFGLALGHTNGIFTEGGVTLSGWGTGSWAGVGNFYGNNSDSRTDLVVARPSGGFAVAYGTPNGTLAEGPISLANWTVSSWAGTADFDGDGFTDILIARAGGGFDLALGHASGVFTEGGTTLPGWGTGTWTGVGNFYGNARHDLVVARPQGGFAVAYASANGSLNEGPVSLTNWTVTGWAGTGDFNGDGYTDILVAQPSGGFGLALGHDNGIFTEGGVTLPGWGAGKWASNGTFIGTKGYGYALP